MRLRHCLGMLAVAATLLACTASEKSPASYLPERDSPAFAQAASLHASEVAELPASPAAGIWVVEDSLGNLVASGVLAVFPDRISSEDYGTVVPGAAGREAKEFGLARTLATATHPALRVAYVTVGGRS